MRIDVVCVVRIESNRKVPQTSLLSLGELDMDGGSGEREPRRQGFKSLFQICRFVPDSVL